MHEMKYYSKNKQHKRKNIAITKVSQPIGAGKEKVSKKKENGNIIL